ncbi:hypothetical protein WG66_000045, partial [Moniliophthora roreri]
PSPTTLLCPPPSLPLPYPTSPSLGRGAILGHQAQQKNNERLVLGYSTGYMKQHLLQPDAARSRLYSCLSTQRSIQ